MAEVIQFPCPACGATLRLPLAMAGIHGPCPLCRREIIAPDPSNDLAARLPVTEPDEIPEPSAAISEEQTAMDVPRLEPAPSRPLRRGVLLVSILLTATLSLAAGYFIGIRSTCHMAMATSTPLVVRAASPPEPVAPVVAASPAPVTEPAPEPRKNAEPVKVAAAAEAALRAFLDAPDWSTRAAHVLAPDTVRAAMEAYSRKLPDGPTPHQSISVENSYTDRETGNTLFIFKVVTEARPTGIPVAVAETDRGWLIDWQAFVEFRDGLFEAFAKGPVDKSGRFHLLVSAPPPPRAADTENKHFSSFLLEPPFPGQQRLAYVRKTAGIHAVLSQATSNGAVFTPVLEVAKRKTPDGKSYLEITDIIAHNWLPKGR